MKAIAVQTYVKIERRVSSIQQQDIEHERKIYMYPDKIMTKYREFPTDEVTDMSYRTFGENGGLLYLHTDRGVFSYTVKTSPMDFIDAFKKQVKREY